MKQTYRTVDSALQIGQLGPTESQTKCTKGIAIVHKGYRSGKREANICTSIRLECIYKYATVKLDQASADSSDTSKTPTRLIWQHSSSYIYNKSSMEPGHNTTE